MDLRTSLQHTLLTLIGVFCLPISASALPPFDITDQTTRTVVIWFDNNSTDPSSVGNDLEFAYNGTWSSDGTTGTIVVDKDDVIAVFPRTGISGTPADTANWSDQTTTVDIATGAITSMSQTGKLVINGIPGDLPFIYDINTTRFDTVVSNGYTQTGFGTVSIGPETFTGWCADTNPGQLVGEACPLYDGPAPFAYNSSTGRFNAIGVANLATIYIYATFGDAQLFEEFDPDVPALSDPMIAVLVLALLAIGAAYTPREAGVM
jgi:hypothetical protein